jgi:NAD(P)-dependent dehydrogenase (short-subunit alcohol dehydrogenase family)
MISGLSEAMQNKICMVTGATSGIGKATALGLARRGAIVIIVARNAEKATATATEIREATRNETVEFMLADLADLSQVRKLAETFKARHDHLDVLVNNAGAIFLRRELSADGYEKTFAVNHLAPFLLTNLLLDELRASPSARVINVSSDSHERAELDFNNLESEKRYGAMRVYGKSKLANIYFTKELARRLAGTSVTVNALHPGFVGTNMSTNNGWFAKVVMRVLSLIALTPEQGAGTSLFLATSPEVHGVSGEYFVKAKLTPTSATSHDREVARRLWQVSEEMTRADAGA